MDDRQTQFINYVKDNQTLLPIDVWKQNTNLYKIWQQRVKENDIRYKLCNGDVEVFVDTIYNFLAKKLDQFLIQVYNSGFSIKEFRNLDIIKLVDDNTISNVSNNPGYFRNVCYEEIVICGGDADINLSIKNAITNTLKGKIRKTFFMPALFEDIYNNVVSSNMVLTFNKSCKLVSVFSPNVYRYLLRRLCKHSTRNKSVLFATASWGVPVVAADELNYDIVDIVDVQNSVLDKCHIIKNELFDKKNKLFGNEYQLTTFCTPSEVMDQIISKKYDHIISCPPYYDLEIYSASTKQSTDLYKTYNDWLENYWRKTVKASKNLLNIDGVFSFVMGHHVRYYYMSKDMVNIVLEEGFILVDEVKIMPKKKTNKLYMSPVEKYEICSIFKLSKI